MVLCKIERPNLSRELIVKIHGRCNLACDYCYVYEHADQTWRSKPKAMSYEVIDQTAIRLGEYMREHQLPSMWVVIHGGEPLLAGSKKIAYLVDAFRKATPGHELLFNLQTNGVLLTPAILDMCLERKISIGISLDGDEAGNRHRPLRSGESSYGKVRAGLELFRNDKYQCLLKGILCVIDLKNDSVATFNHLAQFGVPVDFLLPLGHWDNPPPGSWPLTGQTKYADWLIKVYECLDQFYPPMRSRFLMQMMRLTYWHRYSSKKDEPFPRNRGIEVIGPWVVGALVVEVDGTYELLDGYKTVREGEAATGLNVFEHFMTEALVAMLQITEQRGIKTPCQTCQECPFIKECGGGYYLNRFGNGSYQNPSVYCEDLKKIFGWLQQYLERTLG